MESLKIDKNLFLVKQAVNTVNETVNIVKTSTNFIFIVDVSGSMSYDLQLIRKQLKNKLSTLVKEGDTISIIWFSGNNDAGVLKEEVEIQSLKSLQDLNNSIDRFLKPIGLTAFAKPLGLAYDTIQRIKTNRPNSLFSLIFLTDGCNNDCSWSEVKKSLSKLENDVTSSVFVEYGYYADSEKLSEMAEIIGGEKITANGFDEFEPIFEEKLTKKYNNCKKVAIDIPEYKLPFVFTITDTNEIVVYAINDNKILITSDVKEIYFFNENSIGVNNNFDEKILYTSAYVLTDKTLAQEAELTLGLTGDVNLFNIYSNSFGKQKLNDFKSLLKEAISDKDKRYLKGKSDKLIIDENAYSVLNLMFDLSEFDDNMFYPSHDDFNYKRIGKKRVQKETVLSQEDKDALKNIESIDQLLQFTEELNDKKIAKFNYFNENDGYSLSNLVWNEDRANLSVRIRVNGYVELPKNNFNLEKVDSYIYRTYTIIKDGILNITKLPVSLNEKTYEILVKQGLITEPFIKDKIYVIDFSLLPVINRGMVKTISAEKLALLEWELLKLKANNKVYKYYDDLLFPRVSKGFVDIYGAEVEAWFKEIGITEYNGFSPKTDTVPSTDFYMSTNLLSKIEGCSSLPKVIDVETKIKNNKDLKISEWLMKEAIESYFNQINSELYKTQDESTQKLILEKWLKTCKEKSKIRSRELMGEISKIKFSLILSKKWFIEFPSREENTIKIKIDGKEIVVKFDNVDKKEEI